MFVQHFAFVPRRFSSHAFAPSAPIAKWHDAAKSCARKVVSVSRTSGNSGRCAIARTALEVRQQSCQEKSHQDKRVVTCANPKYGPYTTIFTLITTCSNGCVDGDNMPGGTEAHRLSP
jgi:hypothetical protein